MVFCESMGADLSSTLGDDERGRWGWMRPAMGVRGITLVLPENFGNFICQTVHFGNIYAIIGPQNAPILLCWILILRRF